MDDLRLSLGQGGEGPEQKLLHLEGGPDPDLHVHDDLGQEVHLKLV